MTHVFSSHDRISQKTFHAISHVSWLLLKSQTPLCELTKATHSLTVTTIRGMQQVSINQSIKLYFSLCSTKCHQQRTLDSQPASELLLLNGSPVTHTTLAASTPPRSINFKAHLGGLGFQKAARSVFPRCGYFFIFQSITQDMLSFYICMLRIPSKTVVNKGKGDERGMCSAARPNRTVRRMKKVGRVKTMTNCWGSRVQMMDAAGNRDRYDPMVSTYITSGTQHCWNDGMDGPLFEHSHSWPPRAAI